MDGGRDYPIGAFADDIDYVVVVSYYFEFGKVCT